jgi:hypothetical protein
MLKGLAPASLLNVDISLFVRIAHKHLRDPGDTTSSGNFPATVYLGIKGQECTIRATVSSQGPVILLVFSRFFAG